MLSMPDRSVPDQARREGIVGGIYDALIGALELFGIYPAVSGQEADALAPLGPAGQPPRECLVGRRVGACAAGGGPDRSVRLRGNHPRNGRPGRGSWSAEYPSEDW